MKQELEKKNEISQKMKIFKLYERERLKNNIIEAEKKVMESRLNEAELMLKLKCQEYDELLKWKESDDSSIEKRSFGTQTTIEESSIAIATAAGIKAVAAKPAITAGEMIKETTSEKAGRKRKQLDLVEPRRSKRKAKFLIQNL